MSIKIKNKLFHLFIRTKKEYYHVKFKYYRNKLKHLINLSKRCYYQNYFALNNNKTKAIWKGINQLVTARKSNQNFPSKINQGNVTITNKKEIADAFNTYFANVGSKLAESIPASSNSFQVYLSHPNPNNFFYFSNLSQRNSG